MIKINQACIDLIKSFEGLVFKPYHGEHDPPKIFTIGYGTIKYPPNYLNGKNVSLDDPAITQDQAEQFLTFYVKQKANAIDSFLRDDLSENQFAALISFAYNCGEGALRSSTLLKRINENPIQTSIRDAFMMWVKDEQGNSVPGLVRRRAAEADLYFTV